MHDGGTDDRMDGQTLLQRYGDASRNYESLKSMTVSKSLKKSSFS